MNTTRPQTPQESVPLCMVRRHWKELPDGEPPNGWQLRRYEPGDEAHWRRIHLAAERDRAVTPALFREQFGHDDALLAKRQYYLLAPNGQPVGTATAWFDDHFEGDRWGRVHWVAILPAHQGQGLGRPLLAAVCGRLRKLGHERAFLRTAANRFAALRLYLRFGFEPHPRNAAEEQVWRAVLARREGGHHPEVQL